MRHLDPLPAQYRRLLARVAAARRARRAARLGVCLSRERQALVETDALGFLENLPLRARLANRFTDAMFAMEDALIMCEAEQAESRDTSWIEPHIRTTYEHVNALMEAVSD
jgi:Leu/Phe-tRNA-protein transferase